MSCPTTTTTNATNPDTSLLLTLAQTAVLAQLPPSSLSTALSQPPFVALPDTFNTRDLGLVPNSPIRPRLIYRSGGFFAGLSPEGKDALVNQLGVTKIFDLRSAREHDRRPDPEVDGVEVVWVRPEEKEGEEQQEVGFEEFVEGQGERGYVRLYLDVLRSYKPGIRRVLEFVRDATGNEAGLIHCTAGRDRTGVVAGLLLSLAGASMETVGFDYILSRIGVEPVKEQLIAIAMKGYAAKGVDAPGVQNFFSLRTSCWEAFDKAVDAEYGGFEGYVTKALGFSEEELAKIKGNLVAAD
ncbi:hypothetical protein VTI74DRAFT_1820 [Chaetomium olivicolor]